MKRSSERILTTHVGSLPRPTDLLDIMQAKEAGLAFDGQAHAAHLRAAVSEIVNKQVELGIDIIDDGEYGKPSFVTYMNERLGGFEPAKGTAARSHWLQSREALSFPEFYNTAGRWVTGPIEGGRRQLQALVRRRAHGVINVD